MTQAGHDSHAQQRSSQAPQRPDGQPSRPTRGARRSLLNWRDWGLPAKLAAVTVVPLAMALVLGVTTVSGQAHRAAGYERVDRLVELSGEVRTVLHAVQDERDEAADRLSHGRGGPGGTVGELRTAVDDAIGPMNQAADRAVAADQRIAGRHTDATGQLDRLSELRDQVDSGRVDAPKAIDGYTAITRALLDLNRVVVSRASEGAVGGSANALHNLEVVKEELAAQKARLLAGIARGNLSPTEIVQLRTSMVRQHDRLGEFRAVASDQLVQDFQQTVSGDTVAERDRLLATALGDRGTPAAAAITQISEQDWSSSSDMVIGLVGKLAAQVGTNLANIASEQYEQASSATGLATVLLFAAFLLAIAVVVVITRQLLRSLRVLRRGALDVADRQLPAAVTGLRSGAPVSDEVEPVSVYTRDEVGQVARAFDTLHQQALRLAIEQTSMRTSYSNVFVNLSRRSQSLVQRQLQLIERLERDEEDSEQLSTLFQLDHLATRMRRNNENLLVLSGNEPGRRSGQPIAMSDLLRAAVSEIEQYQRVSLQPAPSVLIVGYAGSDLMRLIAELLDNATAFSAPDTSVTVATRVAEDGTVSVDVLDQGIGMSSEEVAEANERLASTGAVDPVSSRRMGLFVVGRLAGRHRIQVQLHGGKDIVGVRATVIVPADLVVAASDEQRSPAGDAGGPAPRTPSSTVPPDAPGELPRRQRPTNGAARPGALSNLAGTQSDAGTQDSASRNQGAGSDQSTGRIAGAPVGNVPGGDEHPSGVGLFNPVPATDPADAGAPSDAGATTSGDGSGRESSDTGSDLLGEGAAHTGSAEGSPEQEASEAGISETGVTGAASAGDTQHDAEGATGSALSDWWATTTRGHAPMAGQRAERAPATTESTPIFDEMLSAWFRAAQPQDPDAPDPAVSGGAGGQWSFAADAGWQTVDAVSRSAPAAFTDAGLPRRVRGEKLVPGTAGSDAVASTERQQQSGPRRDPQEVRGRLSSFQQGVNRGREAGSGTPRQAVPATDQPAAFVPSEESPAGQSATGEGPAGAGPGTAQARTAEHRPDGVPAGEPGESLWRHRGAFEPAEPAEPDTAEPDTADPDTADAGEESTGQEGAGQYGPGEGDRDQGGAERHGATGPESRGESTAGEWSFAADAGQQAVDAASRASPATFTEAGLPRRVRGEQLFPGSAAESGRGGTVGTERSARDVRGRLSSFQQGIRRGRHQLAQQSGSNNDEETGG